MIYICISLQAQVFTIPSNQNHTSGFGIIVIHQCQWMLNLVIHFCWTELSMAAHLYILLHALDQWNVCGSFWLGVLSAMFEMLMGMPQPCCVDSLTAHILILAVL